MNECPALEAHRHARHSQGQILHGKSSLRHFPAPRQGVLASKGAMSARFQRVPDQRARTFLLSGLALVVAFSCSVFPDQAELPPNGDAGAGGEPGEGGSSFGAAGQTGPSEAGQGGARPAGLAGAEPAGGGAGGATECATEKRVLAMLEDTWIEAAKPATAHGSDPILWVAKGDEERRALLSFPLLQAPPGAVLVRAELRLHLESNADVTLTERHLEAHLLEHVVDEARTTWNNYDSGAANQWVEPGGDFGPAVAATTVPALIQDGPVTFDLTSALSELFSTDGVPLPLIVLEVGSEPTPPAELAFTSSEGDDLGAAPQLFLEYCP
jgi:hypothetical protein